MANDSDIPEVEGPAEDPNPVLSESFKLIEAMQALQAHYAWHALVKIMQEHIDQRFSAIIEQRNSLDELIAQEFIKGQCHSLLLIKNMPAVLIETAKQTIANMTGKSAEEHNHE